MRSRALILALWLGWIAAPAIAPAAELTVYSAGAMEAGLGPLVESFRRESGYAVRLTVAVPNLLRQRVEAGETPDVLIAPVPVMEALARALRDGPRETVGKVGVAVVVRAGARVPDVATPEALRQALLDCESLVFNRASTGTYFERVLDGMGIAEAVAAKTTRYPDGAAVMEHVIRGRGYEIGIGPVTEIRPYESKGLRFVGPLPAPIQNYTTYVAGVLTNSASPEPAAAFIRHLTTAAARAVFAATGVE
jgi:molybdate transport system substrate-binding protein